MRLFSLAALGILAAAAAFAQSERYALFLEDPPVAARFTAREDMRTPAAAAYRDQIELRQQAVQRELASRNIAVTGSVSALLNAVFVVAPPSRIAELEGISGVVGVRPMRRGKKAMNQAAKLVNAPAAWTKLGGQQNAGAGMKIAILDTGIDQTHPAFQDSSLPMPSGFPLCTTGHAADCAYTNNKVIVARSYVRMIGAGSGPADSMPDDFSPRDRDGHGTAVASAAAANQNTGAITFTGIAPKAYLGNYKIYGSGGVNDFPPEDVWIKAIEDALKDGMDVANLSSGLPPLTGALDTGSACGAAANTPCDPLGAAFEAAVKAGLVITVSAGNDGTRAGAYPSFNSISSPATAPSVIAAGATINSHVLQPSVSVAAANAPSGLVGIAAQAGDSFFFPSFSGANQGTLVDADSLGTNACSDFSKNGPPPGSYLLIQKNTAATCDLFTQALNALTAGAGGIVFYMNDSSAAVNPVGILFLGPVVMVSNSDGLALKSYLKSNGPVPVLIDLAGTEQSLSAFSQYWSFSPPLAANQLASYSSLGPAPDGTLKPDLVATGGFDPLQSPDVNNPTLLPPPGIYLAGQNYDPNGFGFSVNRYLAADGTSNSAPIVAGAAALVKQAHPGYTPAQIKSALVNAAAPSVTTDDFGNPVDVQSAGAGLLDAGAAASATVTAEPATLSFRFLQSGGLPVTKSISVTNKGTASVTLAATVAEKTPVSGTNLAVLPASLTLAAGASGTLNVTLSGSVPRPGEYSGFVNLQGGGASLRIPYLYLAGTGVAASVTSLMGGGLVTPGQDAGPAVIQVLDQYGVPVSAAPVVFSVNPRRSATLQSVPGAPACTPASSVTGTTCNTDSYGNAYVDVMVGSNSSSSTVTASASGMQVPMDYLAVTPPLITAAGVVNVADYQAPVAPGSYISIFGQNLVDSMVLQNPAGDVAPLLPSGALPLTADAVTVSFDVPAAGISAPGYMFFVSPGQIDLQVPWELQGQTSAQVKVTLDEPFSNGSGIHGNVVTVPLADYTPAFFENPPGAVAALDGSFKPISAANPVVRGQVAQLFANGLGPVTNPPASGDPAPGSPFSQTTTQPVVTIGGERAQVSFSGLAPGFAGLYQINVVVPADLTPGKQSITVAIGGRTSPASGIVVR